MTPATGPTRTPAPTRTRTRVDEIADRYVDDVVAADPETATYLGIGSRQGELTDHSPDGVASRVDADRRLLAALDGVEPADETDRVTLAAMRERLGLGIETYDAGLAAGRLDNIASPLQGIRDVFDLMPTDTPQDWATIAQRMHAVPGALAGYRTAVLAAVAAGHPPTRRAVTAGTAQAQEYSGTKGSFAGLARLAPKEAADDVARGADAATSAYADLAVFLRQAVAPHAREQDACGREEYALRSRSFTGATLDLEETYAWGIEESRRIAAEMEQVAAEIVPGGGVAAAIAALDADPAVRIDDAERFRTWMQEESDRAIAELSRSHFDIPEEIRTLECLIAPTHSGVIYYTGPSEDFVRPGRMWWAVPEDQSSFSTWRETTTVYHEGVPGHHLQVAQTQYRKDDLNRWRRLLCWTSGHGEGWALYAERLMDELGFLATPGARLGMLDGQALRAARVVVDIGVHCGFEAPSEVGGGSWSYGKAWDFLRARTWVQDPQLRFELDRYMTWPGQAPSYKVGERVWMDLREQVRAREGDAFDLTTFHRRALDLGSLGLDTLREALLR